MEIRKINYEHHYMFVINIIMAYLEVHLTLKSYQVSLMECQLKYSYIVKLCSNLDSFAESNKFVERNVYYW